MRVGSLFAGIGGLDLGLERAGMRTVWQVEIDPYCRSVLERHFPDAVRYEDVRDCGAHNLEPVDLICGGFPCQPVSVAGARKGDEDERWLWPEFARIVREVKPRWVLVENVPGLRSIDDGRLFGEVLRDLAGCGYACEWNRVSAASVGAPHLRERVFIVGYADSDGAGERRNGHALGSFAGTLREGRDSSHSQDAGTYADEPGSSSVANAASEGLPGSPRLAFRSSEPSGFWEPESPFCGVADGVPRRMAQLKALGNSVVPQVAEYVGQLIMDAEL